MLDEFDVPNVEEAVEAMSDEATSESWERIKIELMADTQTTVVQQLNDAVTLLCEALDAHRGQNVDAWFWANVDRVNTVIAQQRT
jgi:hypothetical protein